MSNIPSVYDLIFLLHRSITPFTNKFLKRIKNLTSSLQDKYLINLVVTFYRLCLSPDYNENGLDASI